MFSSEPRCVYRSNPLAEVVCILRFPEILSIGTNPPAQFQEAIRSEFPRYAKAQNKLPPNLPAVKGNPLLAPGIHHQFSSLDGAWRIDLSGTAIALVCSRYKNWEEFAKRLDKPLASFIQLYRPACFERASLRYLNFFSRKSLDLEGIPFRELIQPQYLGVLADGSLPESACTRSGVDAEFAIRGGCCAKLHAGPGIVKRLGIPDQELKFIFDLELYMAGQIPVNHSAGALQTIHSQAYPLFRGAITRKLHEAMEPDPT